MGPECNQCTRAVTIDETVAGGVSIDSRPGGGLGGGGLGGGGDGGGLGGGGKGSGPGSGLGGGGLGGGGLGGGGLGVQSADLVDQGRDIEGRLLKPQFASLDLGKVQDIRQDLLQQST